MHKIVMLLLAVRRHRLTRRRRRSCMDRSWEACWTRAAQRCRTRRVEIVNSATTRSRAAVTTEDGSYAFTDVPAGSYTLTVTAKGFRVSRTNNVQVAINAVARNDVRLQVGEVAETVNVEASAAVLQTDTADLHVSLGSRQITELPLPGYRNYQTLINLVPGATPANYQNAVSGSPGRSLNTNINGTSNTSNNTRLDGALNMRGSLPAQSLYVPPAESIQTVNIATNNFDAEQGLAGGAAINVITKSGTNAAPWRCLRTSHQRPPDGPKLLQSLLLRAAEGHHQ